MYSRGDAYRAVASFISGANFNFIESETAFPSLPVGTKTNRILAAVSKSCSLSLSLSVLLSRGSVFAPFGCLPDDGRVLCTQTSANEKRLTPWQRSMTTMPRWRTYHSGGTNATSESWGQRRTASAVDAMIAFSPPRSTNPRCFFALFVLIFN